jgi:hypothetical protein
MKIQNVLTEDGGGAVLAYKQLSPLQVGILRKIASNKFNFDDASPQAHDAVEGLAALGLVDDIALDITERGTMALNYANKLGGSVDRRNLGQARDNFRQQGSQGMEREPDESMEIE